MCTAGPGQLRQAATNCLGMLAEAHTQWCVQCSLKHWHFLVWHGLQVLLPQARSVPPDILLCTQVYRGRCKEFGDEVAVKRLDLDCNWDLVCGTC